MSCRVLCPRVHFKIIVFDCKEVYIGSANLTVADWGMTMTCFISLEMTMLPVLPLSRWLSVLGNT